MRLTPSQIRATKTRSTLIGFILGLIAGWFLAIFGLLHHGTL